MDVPPVRRSILVPDPSFTTQQHRRSCLSPDTSFTNQQPSKENSKSRKHSRFAGDVGGAERRSSRSDNGDRWSERRGSGRFRARLGSLDILPRALVEEKTSYKEQIGSCHFFTQFRDVIFKCRGSVLPNIVAELLISFSLGWLAYLMFHLEWFYEVTGGAIDSLPRSVEGHSLFGVLLGFLIVFRTQSGFNFMLEGVRMKRALNIPELLPRARRSHSTHCPWMGSPSEPRVCPQYEHLNVLNRTLRGLAIEVLASIPVSGVSPADAELVHSCMRRLKLYYYTVIEHLRSNDSMQSWLEAVRAHSRSPTDLLPL